MKRKCVTFVLALLLVLSVGSPALAIRDYGAIYDETESLGSQYLQMQGEETLPQVSEELGLDLRVDVLTEIADDYIGDTAAWIYEEFGYGYGPEKEGVSLTILLEPAGEDCFIMPEKDGWCVYASLSPDRGNSQDLANAIRDVVEPYMVERVWNGEDMTMSATALTQIVDDMVEAASNFLFASCPPYDPWEDPGAEDPQFPATQAPVPETPAPEVPGDSDEDGAYMAYMFDASDLLTIEEWEKLESRAKEITQRYNCGVYMALLDDYTDYGSGSVADVTEQIYQELNLGAGLDRDGIFLLLSLEERDFTLYAYGDLAKYAFDDYGREKLSEEFLGDFGDNRWYDGFAHYLDGCDEYLAKAQEGKPVRSSPVMWIAIAIGGSCLVAIAVCLVLKGQMKSVRQKAKADEYLSGEGLILMDQHDHYTHTTTTRTKIAKESSDSDSGGSSTSGKF